MGVPGLWDILRPTGQVHSLTHLAVQSGFVENREGHRAYRIGIDASIWFFHAQGGREGENPELRTLFFRCARLLAMPYLPIFVFDGPKRPKIKRGRAIGGKEHWMVNSLRMVLDAFGFECRTAPGEAEAELAHLNRIGVIDAVLSDDVDCFLFGARTVIRNSSATLSGNRAHGARNADGKDDGQHAYMYHLQDIESHPDVKLTQGGLILIALLCGGDYDQQGIDGCGTTTAHALARAGLGDTLLTAALTSPTALSTLLPTWRHALRTELATNASGHAPRKSPTLAKRIPDSFPRLDVLKCYTHPVTSESDITKGSRGGTSGLETLWQKSPNISKIAHVCELYFEWGIEKTIIKRFRSFLWPGAVLRQLLQAVLEKDAARHVSKHTRRIPETPSKTLARSLHRLELDSPSSRSPSSDTNTNAEADTDLHSDTGSNPEIILSQLITGIRSERRHASTDHTLEYRLEINPSTLVAHARAGIQGLRTEMKDSAGVRRVRGCGGDGDGDGFGADDDDDDDEGGEEGEGDDDDDDEGKKKKGTHKTTSVDPESMLRVWIPAVVVQQACPGLARAYMERKEEKKARKAGKERGGTSWKMLFGSGTTTKGKGKWKPRDEEEEEEIIPVRPPEPNKSTRDVKDTGEWKGKQRKEGDEDKQREITLAKALKPVKTTRDAKDRMKWEWNPRKNEEEEEEEEETTPMKPFKFKPVKTTCDAKDTVKRGSKARKNDEEEEEEITSVKPPKPNQTTRETGTSTTSKIASNSNPIHLPTRLKSNVAVLPGGRTGAEASTSRANTNTIINTNITTKPTPKLAPTRPPLIPRPFPLDITNDDDVAITSGPTTRMHNPARPSLPRGNRRDSPLRPLLSSLIDDIDQPRAANVDADGHAHADKDTDMGGAADADTDTNTDAAIDTDTSHNPLKKSPRKCFKHTSPHKSSYCTSPDPDSDSDADPRSRSRRSSAHPSPRASSHHSSRAASPTPSPHRHPVSHAMKPLHLDLTRSVSSNIHNDDDDDDIIVISSDSDDALHVSRMKTAAAKPKPRHHDTREVLPRKKPAPRNVDEDWEVIDLT